MSETKKSNYEEKLLKKMNAEKDQAATAERSYRKASNLVTQQISALEVKRVDLQIKLEEKTDALEDATVSENFSISKYDAAYQAVQEVEDELADVEATLEKRKELLKSWA